MAAIASGVKVMAHFGTRFVNGTVDAFADVAFESYAGQCLTVTPQIPINDNFTLCRLSFTSLKRRIDIIRRPDPDTSA